MSTNMGEPYITLAKFKESISRAIDPRQDNALPIPAATACLLQKQLQSKTQAT
jgi:hypothetical protein